MESFFLSVLSVKTFCVVLDCWGHAGSRKNCPVKLFDAYLSRDIRDFVPRPKLPAQRPVTSLRHASKTTNKR